MYYWQIDSYLQNYDQKKGLFRKLFGDSLAIFELRNLYKEYREHYRYIEYLFPLNSRLISEEFICSMIFILNHYLQNDHKISATTEILTEIKKQFLATYSFNKLPDCFATITLVNSKAEIKKIEKFYPTALEIKNITETIQHFKDIKKIEVTCHFDTGDSEDSLRLLPMQSGILYRKIYELLADMLARNIKIEIINLFLKQTDHQYDPVREFNRLFQKRIRFQWKDPEGYIHGRYLYGVDYNYTCLAYDLSAPLLIYKLPDGANETREITNLKKICDYAQTYYPYCNIKDGGDNSTAILDKENLCQIFQQSIKLDPKQNNENFQYNPLKVNMFYDDQEKIKIPTNNKIELYAVNTAIKKMLPLGRILYNGKQKDTFPDEIKYNILSFFQPLPTSQINTFINYAADKKTISPTPFLFFNTFASKPSKKLPIQSANNIENTNGLKPL